MGTAVPMATDRSDQEALYRLIAWLSPAYPVGAFCYSHGLEYAVETELVHNMATARDWVQDVLRFGSARNDGVFLTCAHRAVDRSDRAALLEAAELAAAFAPSAELALETSAQGAAFLTTTRQIWPCPALDWLIEDWPGPYAYPVAVGVAAAGHGIALAPTQLAYLGAFSANVISAAVRLVPLGQSDGQRLTADIEPTVVATADLLQDVTLDEAGTATFMADYASMKHETQYTRLFRS